MAEPSTSERMLVRRAIPGQLNSKALGIGGVRLPRGRNAVRSMDFW